MSIFFFNELGSAEYFNRRELLDEDPLKTQMHIKDIMITILQNQKEKWEYCKCLWKFSYVYLHVHIDVIHSILHNFPVGFQVKIGPQYTLLVERGFPLDIA